MKIYLKIIAYDTIIFKFNISWNGTLGFHGHQTNSIPNRLLLVKWSTLATTKLQNSIFFVSLILKRSDVTISYIIYVCSKRILSRLFFFQVRTCLSQKYYLPQCCHIWHVFRLKIFLYDV